MARWVHFKSVVTLFSLFLQDFKPEQMIQRLLERATVWFKLVDDLIDFCYLHLPDIKGHSDDGQRVISAILYRRIVSAYEGVRLLAGHGMYTEGLVLRRSMLE